MAIKILRQSSTLGALNDQGTVGLPLSQPPCRVSGVDLTLAGAGESGCGIWECSPGHFERQVAQAEVMHILVGAGSFTPDDGEPLDFQAGDTLFFSARTSGFWHIRQTLRKVFVILPA